MKKIKDVDGDILLLEATALKEVTGTASDDDPWEARFSDIRKAGDDRIRLYPINGSQKRKLQRSFIACFFGLQPDGSYQIGCRTFTKKTFDTILRAAGASK